INSTYLAPSFATLHGTVGPDGRTTASVIASFCLSLIAAGFGPLLSRFAIDLLAALNFGSFAPEGFAAACRGGAAPRGSPEALDAACRTAVVDATQAVIICCLACMVWPAWHFYLAARGMTPRSSIPQATRIGKPE